MSATIRPQLPSFGTSGPASRRPENPSLGQPYYDESMDALLLYGPQGWEVANWDYYLRHGIIVKEPIVDASAVTPSNSSTDAITST